MDNLGTLQHHAIMGTVTEKVAADFLEKATNTSESIDKFNSKLLIEKLNYTHSINISDFNTSLSFNQTLSNLSSIYANNTEFLFTVQNPTPQLREEWIEIQVPYHNYTVSEVYSNGTISEIVNKTKFLPRLWKNSNSTIVKSFFDLKVNFTDANELVKVYLVKNVGFQKDKLVKPANMTTIPWNMALSTSYKQYNSWDIYNYPSNYKQLRPNRTVKSGSKSLTFDRIQKKKDGAAAANSALA